LEKVKLSFGIFALISNFNNGLLLVQRTDGRWNLPGGGVDEGDVKNLASIEDVLCREVSEETGLEILSVDPRPVGVYATAAFTDLAATYYCRDYQGHFKKSNENCGFIWASPNTLVALASLGDVSGGLVGGVKTSTGKVPRHLQMCLHYFTRASSVESPYVAVAKNYCDSFNIPS
jgi:8-oxo-dGTP pyrophosphatase MutT (NUDIX family)